MTESAIMTQLDYLAKKARYLFHYAHLVREYGYELDSIDSIVDSWYRHHPQSQVHRRGAFLETSEEVKVALQGFWDCIRLPKEKLQDVIREGQSQQIQEPDYIINYPGDVGELILFLFYAQKLGKYSPKYGNPKGVQISRKRLSEMLGRDQEWVDAILRGLIHSNIVTVVQQGGAGKATIYSTNELAF